MEDDRLKAYVTLTLNEELVIRGVRVVLGNQGRLFLAMPSREKPDGERQDIVHPITKECRTRFEQHVLQRYYEVAAGASPGSHLRRA